jgi:pyruvate kinase
VDVVRDQEGRVLSLPSVGCTLGEIIDSVNLGEPIWFDDGKMGGTVRQKHPEYVEVEITAARGGSAKLRGDKGINVPHTNVKVSGLTSKDRLNVEFAARYANMVGLSFVRESEDIAQLLGLLREHRADHLGVILKIETRRSFENLPRLLLTALRSPPLGVMVARGDLGVELGFERLAEVQEEILWLAEAAHVPVIWATQVLDSLARKGLPSRAEVTDAAMAGRAECVMLNKGPMVLPAVKFLDDVLTRMTGHQNKKTAVLRPLGVSQML